MTLSENTLAYHSTELDTDAKSFMKVMFVWMHKHQIGHLKQKGKGEKGKKRRQLKDHSHVESFLQIRKYILGYTTDIRLFLELHCLR